MDEHRLCIQHALSFIVKPLSICPVSDMIWVHTFRDKDQGTSFPSGGCFLLVCQIFHCTCLGCATVSQSDIQVLSSPDTLGHSASTTRTVCPGFCSLSEELHACGIFPFLTIIKSISIWLIWFVNQLFSLAQIVWYLSEDIWNWDANPLNFYKLVSFL